MKTPLSALSLLLIALGITACLPEQRRQESPTDATEGASANTAVETTWDWTNYLLSEELLLGTMPVAIHPKKSIELKAEATGILKLHIEDVVTNVTSGTLWAEMNSERLKSKAERLEIQERKHSLNSMKVEELELPEREAEAYEELMEARKKVQLMERVMNSKAMDKMAALLGVSSEDINEESYKKAKEALDLAERKMQFAQEYEYKLRQDEKRLAEMDMVESKNQYREAKDQSEYYIPFDGELRLNLGLISGQQDYTVMGRDIIGVLNDYSEIHAYLVVNNAGWISLPPDSLRLRLKDRARTEFSFSQDRYIKSNRGREERNYIFRVAQEDDQELRRLTGSTLDADLLHRLKEPCYIVPKLKLSLYAMERSSKREWDSILAELFPGSELVAEGLEHLAITLPSVSEPPAPVQQ